MAKRHVAGWIAAVGLGVVACTIGVVLIQAHARPVADAAYVALGSSYAAGLGLGPRAPGSPIVSQRSLNGYPRQLARRLGISSFTDMTSSGATIRQVLRGGQFGLGPQVDALGPGTTLVTLTAGGNDVGYVGDLMLAATRNRGGALGALAGLVRRRLKPASERDFDGLQASLSATLREIRRRSPAARIVVVTYPAILPAAGTCARVGLGVAQADLLRQVGTRLAAVTRTAAAGAGAILVDMESLSAGHDACSPQPWVNGQHGGDGAAFHPTLAGARATAAAIAAAIG